MYAYASKTEDYRDNPTMMVQHIVRALDFEFGHFITQNILYG